ncbi:MAG: metal ABC transporter permease [Armatimonadota bacterium]|nr:metal ABC transporter permease [Armatimonadota bacterium]MDR5697916.1 metal ABC transporter permease [Armatimonadota bacterium]
MTALYDLFVNPMQYAFMQRALLASLLVGTICAVLSCYLLVKRWALLGDAISHSVLPGVAFAYMAGLPFFTGAVATGMLTALGISAVERHTRIKEDSAMGIMFTGAFALGFVLVSRIRSKSVDLFHILFGNVLGVFDADLILTAATGAVVLAVVFALYKELQLWTFDPVAAAAMGLPSGVLHYTLMLLLSMTIVASLQTVGIVLVVAMLVTPGAVAFLLTDRMSRMLGIAVAVGVVSALSGLFLSYHLNVASGATMVLVATVVFACAMLLSPREGIVWSAIRRRRVVYLTALEDFLKQAYVLDRQGEATIAAVAERLGTGLRQARSALRRLAREGLADPSDGVVRLTDAGRARAQELIRSHRLWERYLVDAGGLSWAEVHAEAERLEHLGTRELAARLDEVLGRPEHDPHGARIPRAGQDPELRAEPLAARRIGDTVEVAEVEDEDPDVLRRLDEKGMRPGARVHVLHRRQDGTLRVRVDGREEEIDPALSDVVLTRPAGGTSRNL